MTRSGSLCHLDLGLLGLACHHTTHNNLTTNPIKPKRSFVDLGVEQAIRKRPANRKRKARTVQHTDRCDRAQLLPIPLKQRDTITQMSATSGGSYGGSQPHTQDTTRPYANLCIRSRVEEHFPQRA